MPTQLDLTERLDSDIRAANIAIDGISGVVSPYNPTTVIVSPANLQAAAQPIINAFDGSQQAQDAWRIGQSENQAVSFMTALGTEARAYRAVAAIMVDEINSLRDWITIFKAAVAAATSLADLKTRVAALPDLPDRTLQQAKNAFIAKIQGGV